MSELIGMSSIRVGIRGMFVRVVLVVVVDWNDAPG